MQCGQVLPCNICLTLTMPWNLVVVNSILRWVALLFSAPRSMLTLAETGGKLNGLCLPQSTVIKDPEQRVVAQAFEAFLVKGFRDLSNLPLG